MGSFHCNTIENKKISFDIIEQLLNESNSDIEKEFYLIIYILKI